MTFEIKRTKKLLSLIMTNNRIRKELDEKFKKKGIKTTEEWIEEMEGKNDC